MRRVTEHVVTALLFAVLSVPGWSHGGQYNTRVVIISVWVQSPALSTCVLRRFTCLVLAGMVQSVIPGICP